MRFTLAVIISVVLVGACLAASAAPAPDLLGYGRLGMTADKAPGVVVFSCADAGKADAVLSKLTADFTWDATLGVAPVNVTVGKVQATGYALAPAGVVLLAESGAQVYVVSGADAATVGQRALGQHLDGAGVKFTAAKRHPAGLDYWDLSALRAYYSWRLADYRYSKWTPEQVEANDKFSRDFGLQTSFQFPFWGVGSEAGDGAFDTYSAEYEIRRALRNGHDVEALYGPAELPWWLAEKYPGDVSQHDPYVLYSAWGGMGEDGAAHLSYWASEPAFAYASRFTQEVYKRMHAVAGDRLAAAAALFGRPGVEAGQHHLSWDFNDYSPAAERGFRSWLRDVQGYSLASLGERWYGEGGHFTSWDQVTVPSIFSFFGGFGETDTCNLLTGWKWRLDGPAARDEGWFSPDYTPGADWVTVDLPPSQAQTFLQPHDNPQAAWMRQEFDPTEWLAKNQGKQIYLVCNTYSGDAVEVYLNNDYFGQIKSQQYWGPIGMKVTLLLRPGRNVLTLRVKEGRILGPVYLTTQQPGYYPYLGAGQNARWADLREFQGYSTYWGHKRVFAALRRADPDLPFKIYGVDAGLWDYYTRLLEETGGGALQFTGSPSSYQPWCSALGLATGRYQTSEEGGQVDDAPSLDRDLAWILFGAEGSHVFYYDESLYKEVNDKTGWFDRHKRLLSLTGKAQRIQPQVAVLHSSRNSRLLPENNESFAWGMDRGILQSIQYDNAVVTDREVLSGAVKRFPVLLDTNSLVMDDAELKALEDYVRAGGTFVALHGTGRDSLTSPDTWGISRLTGCKVIGEKTNRLVTVLPDNPLLKRLAGMTFPGNGLAMDYMGRDHAGTGTVALAPLDDQQGVVPIAKWEDGTIAVAMRTLGKGRVIVLGSTFWTATSDLAGNGLQKSGSVNTEFYKDLLSGLGLSTPISADAPLWVRHMVTKNGLEDWYEAYNPGASEARNLTISWAAPAAATVRDVGAGQPAAATYADGRVTLTGLAFSSQEVKIFGVPHGDWAQAAQSWYADKAMYRQGYPSVGPNPAPLPPGGDVVISQYKVKGTGLPAPGDLAWTTPAYDDATWQTAGTGYWDDQGVKVVGNPADGDTVLYRTHFTAPADWAGRQVDLYLTSFDTPGVFGTATYYINGEKFATAPGHGWNNMNVFDTAGTVHPGDNVLAFSVTVKAGQPGGVGGRFFLRPEVKLAESQDLTSGWVVYADNLKSAPASLPGQVKGQSLRREVEIPASWAGQPVYLHLETDRQWCSCVVINGRPQVYDQSTHPYGVRFDVRVDQYLHPGKNTVELWPFGTPAPPGNESDMGVEKVTLGVGTP